MNQSSVSHLTETGNTNLWYLKTFADNNYLSHIKVNLTDDPNTNAQVLTRLLKNAKAMDCYHRPTILNVNEAALYSGIDELFLSHKSLQKKLQQADKHYGLKWFPEPGLRLSDRQADSHLLEGIDPALMRRPWEPSADSRLTYRRVLEPEEEPLYQFTVQTYTFFSVLLVILSLILARLSEISTTGEN